jgi:plasmid stabilization system protein ParE
VRIAFLSPALREIVEAIQHYDDQAPGLGDALDADLQRTLDTVIRHPHLGSPYAAATRRAFLRRFPYSLVYQVLSDRVLVVALAHHKRRPAYWSDRVQEP